MSTTKIVCAFVFFCSIVSCGKKELEIHKPLPDSRYPFTYQILTSPQWEQLNSEFAKANAHDSLYLNKLGFLEGKIFLGSNDTINADLVAEQTEILINTFKKYLGIPANKEINLFYDLRAMDYLMGHLCTVDIYSYFDQLAEITRYQKEVYGSDYKQEPLSHYFYIPQHSISGSKLVSTRINLYFHETDNSIELDGQWYPDVFIPASPIYTEDEALEMASKVYPGWGDIKLWESDDENSFVSVEKILFPLKTKNKIELHECWECMSYNTNYMVSYIVYIDTQTGDIIVKKAVEFLM